MRDVFVMSSAVAYAWWLLAALLTAATATATATAAIPPPASSSPAPQERSTPPGRGGDAPRSYHGGGDEEDEGGGGRRPSPPSHHHDDDRTPPLILLFVLDQFRYDALSSNPNSNHPYATTPNLDSIAGDGVTFTNAYTSTPTCTPARSALLTGRSPWGHGMLGYGSMSLEYPFELIRALGGGGYHTASIGKNHFGWHDASRPVLHSYDSVKLYDGGGNGFPNTSSFGYDDYDAWFQNVMPGMDPLATGKVEQGMGWNSWRGAPYKYDEYYHPTAWTTREAVKFLDDYFNVGEDVDKNGGGNHQDGENHSRPFPLGNRHNGADEKVSPRKKPLFLKVSYHRPHSPYDPPARLLRKRLRDPPPPYPAGSNRTDWDYRYSGRTNDTDTNCGPSDPDAWCGEMPSSQSRVSRAAYLSNVEFVDEGVGDVIDLLRDRGLYDSSMILVTSDHGDMQGEHHLWRKGYPYQGSVHIPLILKWPVDDGEGGGGGGTTGDATSTRRAVIPSDDDGGGDGRPDGSASDVGKDVGAATTTTTIPHGGTLDQVVELRDLLPTILGAAGVPIPENVTVEGRDLMHLVRRDGNSTAHWREYIDLEHSTVYGYTSWNALTDGGYKYVYHAATGAEQLFHLVTDPNEMVDLVAAASSSSTSPEERDRIMSIVRHWRGLLVRQFETEGRGNRWVLDGKLQIRGGRGVRYGRNFPGDPAPRFFTSDETTMR